MRFRSLKYRVLPWFIGIVASVLFIFSFTLYYFLEYSIEAKIEKNLKNEVTLIYENILQKKPNNKILDSKNLTISEILIFKNYKIIAKTKNFTLIDYSKYLKNRNTFFLDEIDEYRVDAVYVFRFKKPFNGIIILYKKALPNKAEDIEDILLFLNPVLLLILIFVGNKLIDKILIPIKNITKTTKAISIDNFSHTIDVPKNNDEIRELTNSFNEMIMRLKDGVDTLERFNVNVSHELKTPLTVIKGELELALRKRRDFEYYEQSIVSALKQVENIQQLTDSLLLMTRFSKQNIKMHFEICNLDSILLGIIDSYENELNDKNIKLHIQKLESIEIKANHTLISLIFSNLIDNAIKYTPKAKNIYISLFKTHKIHFIIQDEGIGIPKDKLNKITDRFYRVDESRNKDIKGFGLGLSIVKNGVELHDGSLYIDSKVDAGTKVEVVF